MNGKWLPFAANSRFAPDQNRDRWVHDVFSDGRSARDFDAVHKQMVIDVAGG
jgi:hypothetical protein